ncbi:Helix-turn-helix [uncultured Clostridium sp.]|jgi:transcriptional regulator with XRE-family HTH domain|uniref:Helix-turn-helix transcriptional regulator n=1 Tax=Muricoprocola aceti TaxID=2981772 RepID=A0ABT2SML3_9FIRM|nr:helix-turn-helix transcriptional regulator [Muricoprocola aceti]MCU6725541.1 helix-turn-helix transcriptional regulator [Muricoprocola aceti]RGD63537.1 XRE family transcriptional regulator [Lachnospiraceae bacterium OF09-6]SCH54931.1 Helix-turn-helix [uncultured Clostridium sp.]
MKMNVEKIVELMQKRGWTQIELAERAQISRSYLSRVLSGERDGGSTFLIGMSRAFPQNDIRDFIILDHKK